MTDQPLEDERDLAGLENKVFLVGDEKNDCEEMLGVCEAVPDHKL